MTLRSFLDECEFVGAKDDALCSRVPRATIAVALCDLDALLFGIVFVQASVDASVEVTLLSSFLPPMT